MDCYDYVRAIRPYCSTQYAAIGWLDESGTTDPRNLAWIYEKDSGAVSKAIDAYLRGRLPQTHLKYRSKSSKRGRDSGLGVGYLGLVPVDDTGMVHFCVLDFDRKHKDPKTPIPQPITKNEVQLFADWFNARELIAFWSKSGTGAHATIFFRKPFPVSEVVAFAKSWGFNVGGKPHQHSMLRHTDFFPRTEKKSMVWLPNVDEDPEFDGPRPHGLICGYSVEAATSRWGELVKLPFKTGADAGKHLDNDEIGFLFGFVRESGDRNNLVNRVAKFLCHHRMTWRDASAVILNAAMISGFLSEENDKTRDTMKRGWLAGIEDMRAKGEPITKDEQGNPQVATGVEALKRKKEDRVKLHMKILNEIFKKPEDSNGDEKHGNRFGRTGYTPGDLFFWESGVYYPDGQRLVRAYTRNILRARGELDSDWTPGLRNMVIEGVTDHESTIDLSDPTHPGILNLESGLLDFRDGTPKKIPHDPSVPSLVQLPINYSLSGADPKIWDTFLRDLFGHYGKDADRVVRLVKEIIADCMMPTIGGKKARQQAVLLLGPPNHGKSTFVDAVTGLIGAQNVSNLSLEQIEYEKFALCQIFGKALNAHADIGYTKIDTATNFKQLCSGDRILVDRKQRDLLSFSPTCRLIFGANRWPEYRDVDASINRRWLPIQVELRKPQDDLDPKILEKILSPEAKAGLLKDLIERNIFTRLLEGQPYRIPKILMEQQMAKVIRRDPFLVFEKYHLRAENPDDIVAKVDVMYAYNQWVVETTPDGNPITLEKLDKLVQHSFESRGVESCRCPGTHPTAPNGPGWKKLRLIDPDEASLEEEFEK